MPYYDLDYWGELFQLGIAFDMTIFVFLKCCILFNYEIVAKNEMGEVLLNTF